MATGSMPGCCSRRPRAPARTSPAPILWSSAARIPGVHVLRDDGAREAERFGIATSGTVALYDARGKLLFHGGITPARGHEGDSFGRERVISLLATGKADRADAPVFGCALSNHQPVRVADADPSQGENR